MKKVNNVTERPDPVEYTNFLVYPPVLKDDYYYVLELYCDHMEELMNDRKENSYNVNNAIELKKLRVKYARLKDSVKCVVEDMSRLIK